MNNRLILALFFIVTSFGYSQEDITWEDLAQVNFTEKHIPSYDSYFLYPHFGKSLKELEGKEVSITGYFLNIAPEEDIYILSKSPMASCFFCGAAGPETAIELQFKNSPDYDTDAIVTVTGILKLNADDVDHFNYILTNCKARLAN